MYHKSKINTIIVEDDIKSQEYLDAILTNEVNNITVQGFATGIAEAIDLIDSKKPELVFMDIDLKDGLCFEIFKSIAYFDFEVIFVTAHDNYLKEAIHHYAFNFITKPYTSLTIVETVNRYINLKERLFTLEKYRLFSGFISKQDSKILLNLGNKHISIKISDIIRCEADGNYTVFYLNDGTNHMASKTLKYYESLFSGKGFFRANRSVLVNTDFISSIYKKETIILHNNDRVNVSVRNKSKLSDLINSIS